MIKFERFFIAEDDNDDYTFFVEALSKLSSAHNTLRATNGLDCVSILKHAVQLPQIIFLDLNMPIKNGIECLIAIKDHEALQSIPVIIYSTSHYIRDIDAAYKNGAHYYIVKPSDAETLTDVLHVVLNLLSISMGKPSKEKFVVRMNATLES